MSVVNDETAPVFPPDPPAADEIRAHFARRDARKKRVARTSRG
jgi:hypothetical protein